MPENDTDKNVYLLGAGFSKEVGLPLQDDFLLVAKEVYFKNPDMYRHFKKVFEYQNKLSKMRKFLNFPLLNLEQLFNLIEMDIFYSNSDESTKIKDAFTQLICDVLIDKTPSPFIHDSEGHLRENVVFSNYVSFISLFRKKGDPNVVTYKDSIISLNYDLVVEGAACAYNWRMENRRFFKDANQIHFNAMFGKGNINLGQVDQYFLKNRPPGSYFPPMSLFSDDPNAIKLIKLHGSINWKTTLDDKTFIVPPTWNKSDPQIRKLWEIAYEEIKTAKRIIIIGYSFPETDIYIKSLIALALNENEVLQNIYFINPDKDTANKTCLSLLDKYFEKYCAYKEWKFSDLIISPSGREFVKENLKRDLGPL